MIAYPQVAVVVLNYNGRDCLSACLDSLYRLKYPNFFVIVVDNASEDDSLVSAREQFSEVIFLQNRENRGFAAGMNIGMEAAFARGAQWVWLFNNDAQADEESLTLLVEAASKRSSAGLLSPYILDASTGKLWFGKGRIESLRMRAIHETPSTEEAQKESFASEFLTGCALLVKKTVFQEVGPLDERFFLYYEDADYSLRARKHGFETLVVPNAHVTHAEQSRVGSGKLYHLVLSGLLYFEKNASFWQKPYFLAYGTIRRLKNLIDIMRGRDEARVVRRAYGDFYHGH